MAKPVLDSLRKLAKEKSGLRDKERQIADAEHRLLQQMARVLSRFGYRLVAADGRARKAGALASTKRPLPKTLKCPKCDRRFAHRLPMARHMSATHGAKKATSRKRRSAAKQTG